MSDFSTSTLRYNISTAYGNRTHRHLSESQGSKPIDGRGVRGGDLKGSSLGIPNVYVPIHTSTKPVLILL